MRRFIIILLCLFSASLEANPVKPIINASFLAMKTDNNKLDLHYGKIEDQHIPDIIQFLINHPEITEVDLSHNDELSGNSFVAIATLPQLRVLNLGRGSKLCEKDYDHCIGGLNASEMGSIALQLHLTDLNIDLHSIGDEGAKALAHNTTLKKLSVHYNHLTDKGVEALMYHPALKALDLAMNTVSNKGAMALAENKTLEILNINAKKLDTDVALAFANTTTLKELSIVGLEINDAIIHAFSQNQSLESLSLWHVPLTVDQAKMLAQNTRLKTLALSGSIISFDNEPGPDHFNGIGDEGAIALAQNTTLQHLVLIAEDLTPISMAAFAQNTTLKSLNLDFNRELGDEGLLQLSSGNSQLEKLVMGICNIGDEGVNNLAHMKQLKNLTLLGNHIGDKGAHTLSQNTTLRKLILMGNEISDAGAVSLSQNTTLEYLSLLFNKIGFIGVRALKNNKHFKYLEVAYQRDGDWLDSKKPAFKLQEMYQRVGPLKVTGHLMASM